MLLVAARGEDVTQVVEPARRALVESARRGPDHPVAATIHAIDWLGNRAAVDAAITEWTSTRTKQEVTRVIAGAGVPCGALMTTLELMHDPDLHQRGMMQTIEHPVRGPVIVAGWPLRMSDTKVPLKCAPILGADSEAIYDEWLGCSPDEVRDMRQGKVI